MVVSTIRGRAWSALILGVMAALTGPAARGEEQPRRVRIGMLDSLLKDVPDGMLAALQQPFNTMMAQQTGLTADLVKAGDYAELGRQLNDNEVQLGIFTGIDFAWARQKYPDLKPLMICVNKHRQQGAVLVVRADAPVSGWTSLRGKDVILPAGSPKHCQLFLRRGDAGNDSQTTAPTIAPADFEEALDQVVDGAVPAAVVDQVSLECYQRRKPGRAGRLKVALRSEVFPCACVAYHPAHLPAQTRIKFQQGMRNANQTYLGKRMLNLFRLTAFEGVPPGYEKDLAETAKAYPAPAEIPSASPSRVAAGPKR